MNVGKKQGVKRYSQILGNEKFKINMSGLKEIERKEM